MDLSRKGSVKSDIQRVALAALWNLVGELVDTEDIMCPELIAHHEAAHAVVAIELGLGILDIGIDIARVERTGGVGVDGCRLFVCDLSNIAEENLADEKNRQAGLIDCSGTVLAAGAASDAKMLQCDPWVALQRQQGDFRYMRDLLRQAQLAPTPEEQELRLREQVSMAVEALNDPSVWRAVQAVAQAVLKSGPLTGAEIETIVKPILEPIEC